MPSRHALLGASSAHRWLACPPSARLCENVPDEETPYAAEGTLAHAICEAKLDAFIEGKPFEWDGDIEPSMDEYTDQYVDFIEEELNAFKTETSDAKLLVEQELDFADFVPEGFGTSDAVIVGDDTLEIVDFKYGTGVPVDAVGNPQLRLYALGAYLAIGSLYDFSKVKVTVFQPRISNISSEEISLEELLKWAYEEVKPRAELAFNGGGEFCVGEHCRFCKIGGTCRARAEDAFKVIDLSDEQPELLSDDEIPDILDKLDNAEKWIASLRKYAETKAIREGHKWRGYKLVEGRTRRKIDNPIAALRALEEAGYDKEDITTTSLLGLTDLKKVLGSKNFDSLLDEFISKPAGAPTLVKDSDKRPELNLVEEAFRD